MMQADNSAGRGAAAARAAGCALLAAGCARVAQVSSYGDKQAGREHRRPAAAGAAEGGVTQHLNQQLPLDAQFVDDTGKTVRWATTSASIRRSFRWCTTTARCCARRRWTAWPSALEMVKLTPGKDFRLSSSASIRRDAGAGREEEGVLREALWPAGDGGWMALPDRAAAGDRCGVSNAVGFGYVRVPGPDGKLTQFAHASSIEMATTEGKLAQYYLGVEYSPKDMLLGLIEASGNKIGSPVANILTYCYHYDPQTNKHSLIVARVVQLGGMVTVASLGGFMFVMFGAILQLGPRPRPDRLTNGPMNG
jgi:protein SCO1/2